MCGIVGAVAQRNIVPILLEGLRRLEYRGYDSAGLAIVNETLQRVRSTGRVSELEAKTRAANIHGHLGIGHTRWATHGAPNERNAHPLVSHNTIAVVHNGIIENHEVLRNRLKQQGYQFDSDTDTEVIAHLIHSYYLPNKDLLRATQQAVAELVGAYAIGVISYDSPAQLVCARQGSPLLIGLGIEENFIASDVSALLPVTQKIIYLEEGDIADLRLLEVNIFDASGAKVNRPTHTSELSLEVTELGTYRHFMQKEIHEQPKALADTLELIGNQSLHPELFGVDAEATLSAITGVTILACGTSYHAGLVARYWIEQIAGLPCNVEVASEYRYRDSVPNPQTLIVTISQSGETTDTLAAFKHAQSVGHPYSLTICNVPESALMRQSGLRFLTRAGPEIGVASTKAFTTQLVSLFLLANLLAKLHGRLAPEQEQPCLKQLRQLPNAVKQVLTLEPAIANWATKIATRQHALFIGRGTYFPIALEGALKLKEISYIHAEAYPAGELKHGPLALVDSDMPVIALAPADKLIEKLKSNLQEIRSRGGELFVFSDASAGLIEEEGFHIINLPPSIGILDPIVYTIPLQLLAYHAALQKGTDVDKPRNLAKSVTVE